MSGQVPTPRTPRTIIVRHPDRAVPARIEEFLRAGRIAHVSYVQDGEPRVIPFLYHYEAGHLYLHGSREDGTLARLRDARQVAIGVAEIDSLVPSDYEPSHSANYRSVVVYGRGRSVADLETKRRIMRSLLERYFEGRRAPADYVPASDGDLERMELIDVEIEEAQAKARPDASS